MITTGSTNAEQVRYWNEVAGPVWARLHARTEVELGVFGRAVMDRAGIGAGERVLDIGCGAGGTTVELSRRVGPTGRVLGVDVSGPLLAVARTSAEGIAHVAFEHADASAIDLPEGSFDRLFSRFGVMFFIDPTAAFTKLRGALRPGGRLAFACWRGPQHNPWITVPLMAVAAHVPVTPPDPDAPGPLAFANDARLRAILSGAGFTDIAIEPRDETMRLGGAATLDDAMDYLTQIGPAARAIREAPPEAAERAKAALRETLLRSAGPEGITLQGGVWIVTALSP